MVRYILPRHWIKYDLTAISRHLVSAKAAVLSLTSMPYERSWAEKLQVIQLKREVAGTSRIEGADFTENELDAAMEQPPEHLLTRSQRQAAAAVKAYRWIAHQPDDKPINARLICDMHRMIVTGADDDHCTPGKLRGPDQNVTFGTPRHRGVGGGGPCEKAFQMLGRAVSEDFPKHDLLVQALALHYHLAAMHPFLDGNGRTARALEGLLLQRAGLRDVLFIAMSNYYYDEKARYLAALAEVRARNHDLTPFIVFGLEGIEVQCQRLLDEIRINVSKALFRNLMYDLFKRLRTPRKRVIADRQLEILNLLLEHPQRLSELLRDTRDSYANLKNPAKALIRDISGLISLRAISVRKLETDDYEFSIRLEWPTEITETEFFRKIKDMPTAKTYSFLGH